jgi:hypothetical protein
MPQLDFYSYLSQLIFILIISLVIYIFLVNLLLPTIGITLKLRAYIIESKIGVITNIIDSTNKRIPNELHLVVEAINEILSKISKFIKEETLNKEVNVIFNKGLLVEKIIAEDLEEEFLLQYLRIKVVAMDTVIE